MCGKNFWENLPEEVMVERPVESKWKAVADNMVANVQAGFTRSNEDVIVGGLVGLGLFDLLMNGLGVHESYCEAVLGCKLDGEMNGGDYVALKRVGKKNCMRLWMSIALHLRSQPTRE